MDEDGIPIFTHEYNGYPVAIFGDILMGPHKGKKLCFVLGDLYPIAEEALTLLDPVGVFAA